VAGEEEKKGKKKLARTKRNKRKWLSSRSLFERDTRRNKRQRQRQRQKQKQNKTKQKLTSKQC
jgi:hypothetical protein